MEIVKKSEILKDLAKTGKTKFWRAEIVKDYEEHFFTRTEFWQDNGKHQFSEPYSALSKNIGKSNETSSEEQANKEFEAMIKQQKDQGYVSENVNLKKRVIEKPLPMLAQKYQDRKKNIRWPAAAQPKLDGTRACFNGKIFWSRRGKEYIKEVTNHLYFKTSAITDGEIMISHKDASFQESMSVIKKYKKELSEKLIYYVYDTIIENLEFRKRWDYLLVISELFPPNVKLVYTVNVENEEEFMKFHKDCIKKGFEGSILRNWHGLYTINHRSGDLLKYKDFIDEEFEIIDVVEAGSGSYAGAGKFIVKISNDIICDVNPEGSMKFKQEILKNRKKYIGKLLTVKFQGFTDKGSLRFPVGKGTRDYE